MKNLLPLLLVLVSLSACTKKASHLVIGVSQCSDDEWRRNMNTEILREAMFYENVQVDFRTAKDDSRQQIADIRRFIQEGVDLLVVSPNQAVPITPVVEEAFDKGIPVIVVDRKILSDKYTAYIGADNYEIGKDVGNYVVDKLGKRGSVLEITGLTGSTPATDRHQGFVNALQKYPDIRILESIDAGWLQSQAMEKMDSALRKYPHIDLVYAHNDPMAVGAYLAAHRQNRQADISFIGIDALPNPDCGVDQVLRKVLDATFIYPTGGDAVMQTAMAVLRKKPFLRENILSTAVVDTTNARVMKLQTDYIVEQNNKIELLNTKVNDYFKLYSNQQIVLYASLFILVLLVGISVIIYKAYRSKNKLNALLSKRNNEITCQKEQLEEQRDQLMILSQQLEEATHAKLVFFTNVSHDFRTPLTLIADPVDQLLSDGRLDGEQTKLLGIVKRNVNILLRLVNQILDFRRYENGKLELSLSKANLKQQVEEWNNAFLPAAMKKHLKFSFETIDEDVDSFLLMDWEKIERIYFNLLSNAFKFTPENGKISVKLSTYMEEEQQFLRLIVADTGVGISAEHIRNIFERFYKIDLHHAGSGIGLALVKAFVEIHGGRIQVASNAGQGTVFTVDIPVREAGNEILVPVPDEKAVSPIASIEEEFEESAEEELEFDSSSREVLLIIDDNQDIRDYVRSLFAPHYTVLEAEDGRKGLRKAMMCVPDLIICDVLMPVMDGIECCRRLKQEIQTSHIPIIMLTACALDEQRIEGFECGVDSYISKPFNFKVLDARVRNLLDNRKRMKQFFGDSVSLAKENISDMDKDFINKFKKLIEENLSDSELNVEELGRMMGMSRVQLYRKVKLLTNYAPNELVRIARLKKAASLLVSTEMSISQVTYEVGFTSPSYFTKCYKEYFGKSPTEFLKHKD